MRKKKSVYPSQAERSEYSKLFKVLDGYAKRRHKCFLTELFLNEEDDEYMLCFRPILFHDKSERQGVKDCQYVRIETGEARELARTGVLPVSVATILDEKLQPLSEMR